MPRNQTQGTTLRNRNRVTNKTRLKILKGSIDGDPLILDEEEERARVIATSGVDADDANEHHLQVAINAATQRHSAYAQDLKAHDDSKSEKKDPYIPTPDATGVVKDYENLYSLNCWYPPQTFLRFADSVEDTIQFGLSNGYSYFMDERDKEWLEKNNQSANGESTSAQAIAVGGLSVRSSRTSKAKGKEPDICNVLAMSEDEFEVVMGLFEKETDDRYPFLHVDPSQIPPFSDYEPLFSATLPIGLFSTFTVPTFISDSVRLAKLASIVYSHWRNRRSDSNGRRIMAQLNADESNENDPYVCFRRRDSKPIRKTRTAQNAIAEKMIRLKSELNQSYKIALAVFQREQSKQSIIYSSLAVWNARSKTLELKRKASSLLTKDEEDMLIDKERPTKKAKVYENGNKWSPTQKAPPIDSPPQTAEPRPSPKERYQKIQSEVFDEIVKYRDKCSSWEDVADHSTQSSISSSFGRTFTSFPSDEHSCNNRTIVSRRWLRLRFARGGRIILDRLAGKSLTQAARRRRSWTENSEQAERWRFDEDTSTLDQITNDSDRFLLDDFDERLVSASPILLTEEDRIALSTEQHSFNSNNENFRSQRVLQQRRYNEPQLNRSNSVAYTHPQAPPHSSIAASTSEQPGAIQRQNGRQTNGINNGVNLAAPISASPPLQNDVVSLASGYGEQALLRPVAEKASSVVHHAALTQQTMYQAPVMRQKLQGVQPYLPSQQAVAQSTVVGQLNGDSAGQGSPRHKQPFIVPQKSIVSANIPAAYPMTTQTSLYPMNANYPGHLNIENLNLNMGTPINLKLPPNRTHNNRASPQLPGSASDVPSALVMSPSTSSGSLGSRSPMMRANVNNQLTAMYRGSASPLNGSYTNGTQTSPTLRPISTQQRPVASPATQISSMPAPLLAKQFSNSRDNF